MKNLNFFLKRTFLRPSTSNVFQGISLSVLITSALLVARAFFGRAGIFLVLMLSRRRLRGHFLAAREFFGRADDLVCVCVRVVVELPIYTLLGHSEL